MAYPFDTAANIIGDATVELGLRSAAVADPYGSTDPNVLLLCALLKALGQDLAREHDWTDLQPTHTFDTVASTESYDLPSGFLRIIDDTLWNRTDDQPLIQPVGPRGWATLKGSGYSTADLVPRIYRHKLYLTPTPDAAESLAFEYQSDLWVATDANSTPTLSGPTVATHCCWFDRRLLVCGLKLRFRRGKGFDSTAVQAEYDSALTFAKGGDGAAPVLSLNGGSSARLIGVGNLPKTGYGS